MIHSVFQYGFMPAFLPFYSSFAIICGILQLELNVIMMYTVRVCARVHVCVMLYDHITMKGFQYRILWLKCCFFPEL